MPKNQTDLLPYVLILVIIVIGGVVAWVADWLGRRIGKKRLSFMGLRPRHTATLITVGSGILIPLLTIAIIYASSSDVRAWINEGRKAIQEALDYKNKAAEQKNQNSKLEEQGHTLERTNRLLTGQTKRLQDQLKDEKAKLKNANAMVAAARHAVDATQAKIRAIQGQLTATNRKILSKAQELKTTQDQLKKGKDSLARLQASYKNAASELNDIKTRALELDHQNQGLEQEVGKLQTQLTSLQTQKEQYEGQIQSYKETIASYNESISTYSAKIKQLQTQFENVQGKLDSSIYTTRTRPLIFDMSEELARIQLPPSLSPTAARNAYLDLLQRARAVALAHKALNSPTSASAGLRDQKLDDPPRYISVADQEEAIIRGLTAQRNELVFIARAVGNTFEGEYVVLDFVAFRNKLIYTKGKVVAETKIDGRKSEVEILNAITQFIQQDVRTKALSDGMIPPSGRGASLGVVSNDEMLQLIHSLKDSNVVVRLQALAKDDTKSGDQLELGFRIRY